MFYTVVALFTQSVNLNPVTGSLGLRVGFDFVPELVSTLVFITVGLLTYHIRRVERKAGGPNREEVALM